MFTKFLKIFFLNNKTKFLLLIFCIFLSLSGFIISNSLTQNVKNLIGQEVKPVFGADIRIDTNNNDITSEQKFYLNGLRNNAEIIYSKKIETETTLISNSGSSSLVFVEFVDNVYPIYGKLDIDYISSDTSGVLVTPNLQKDFLDNGNINLFGREFLVSGIIINDPTQGINVFSEGKKVIFPQRYFDEIFSDDYGSLIEYEYLIKVLNPNNFESINEKIKSEPIFEGVRIRDYTRGGDRYERIIGELNNYISYILIITFLLTSLIIFLSIESFYISIKNNYSILRILGLNNKKGLFYNLAVFLFIFLIGFLLSYAFSYFAFGFIRTYEFSSGFELYSSSIFLGFLVGIIILTISILLPTIKFFNSNPLSGLKENFLQVYTKKELIIQSIIVFIGLNTIFFISTFDLLSSIIYSSILFILVILFGYIFKYILKELFLIVSKYKKTNFKLYDSVRSTIRPGNMSILILFSYFVSFGSLIFISIVSLNFFHKINIDLKNDNNLYIVNLKDEDLENTDEMIKNNSFSILRGRILEINNQTLKNHLGQERVSGRYSREFNITDNSLLDNEIVRGSLIQKGEVSVDSEFAKDLKISLGDEITFLILGVEKKLIVSNFRESIRDDIRPFFYFQVYPDDFEKFPKRHFASLKIDTDIDEYKREVLKNTGDYVLFIDVGQIVEQVKSISSKVFIVIQTLFLYVFIFCFIALFMSIRFLIPFKKKKSKLYNILGVSNKLVYKINTYEYYYLQTVGFIFSIIIAGFSSYFVLSLSEFLDYTLGALALSVLLVFILYLLFIFFINLLFKSLIKIEN